MFRLAMSNIQAILTLVSVVEISAFHRNTFNTIVFDRSWLVSSDRYETTWLATLPFLHTCCCADHSQQLGQTVLYEESVLVPCSVDARTVIYEESLLVPCSMDARTFTLLHTAITAPVCAHPFTCAIVQNTPNLSTIFTVRNECEKFHVLIRSVNPVYNMPFTFRYLQNRSLLI
jgi:hypothetical protein